MEESKQEVTKVISLINNDRKSAECIYSPEGIQYGKCPKILYKVSDKVA